MKNIFSKIEFSEATDRFLGGGKSSVVIVLLSLFITAVTSLAVFFVFVQGAEKVLVPNVVGKSLTDALLDMQVKELYPKIQLKYSENLGDKGLIIDQNPKAGSIVKAYRRVTLTVSRGMAIDYIEDYVGKNADEVRNSLELLFSGEDSFVFLPPSVYIKSDTTPGTIIAQYPEPGTPLAEKIKLQFVVSMGNETEKVELPKLEGLSIAQLLTVMQENKIVVDLELAESENAAASGSVISVDRHEETVDSYTRVNAILEIKPAAEKAENVQGIFTCELPDYPYPVPVVLSAKDSEGKTTELLSANHPGKKFTAPYDVKKGSILVLTVLGDEAARSGNL